MSDCHIVLLCLSLLDRRLPTIPVNLHRTFKIPFQQSRKWQFISNLHDSTVWLQKHSFRVCTLHRFSVLYTKDMRPHYNLDSLLCSLSIHGHHETNILAQNQRMDQLSSKFLEINRHLCFSSVTECISP